MILIDHDSTRIQNAAAIVSSQTSAAFMPELTTLGNKAHLVWKQSNAIQYAYGSDISFSAPVAISSVSGSEHPSPRARLAR
jgi:hypothetical protein